MPPIKAFFIRSFLLQSASSAADFGLPKPSSGPRMWIASPNPPNLSRKRLNGLIAPGDSDLDKAKKLYKAVQALDNTDYLPQKS
jgi:hypothetical protein